MSPKKPSDKEEEYFAKKELEQRKRAQEEERIKKEKEAKKKRKSLCHMVCPKCGEDLTTIKHMGVEIDRCGACSGIWLDAGELEILLRKEEGLLKKCLRLMG